MSPHPRPPDRRRIPREAAAAVLALALGCAAPLGPHELIDPVGVDGPDSPLVEGVCFDAAHTIVVGPGPGCVQLRIPVRPDDPVVCDALDLAGAPVRVVRRGDLPVRIDRAVASRMRVGSAGPVDALLALPPGRPGECCVRADLTGAPRWPADFDTLASGDVLELLAPHTIEHVDIEVCALSLGETADRFLAACAEACETDGACGYVDDVSACRADCRLSSTTESDVCLQAMLDGYACEGSPRCERALTDAPGGGEICAEASARRRFECAGS